jgi:magnesium chelatase family protein
MYTKIYSAGLVGVDSYIVTVECDVGDKLDEFEIVGLPDKAVKEARERVKSAVENSGFIFGERKITVNMAPADTKKEGSAYDLALVTALLNGMGYIRADADILERMCFIGEISLSGEVRGVKGVLCMCDAARRAGIRDVFVPIANAGEAAVIEGINVYGVSSVTELAMHLNGTEFNNERQIARTIFDSGEYIRKYNAETAVGDFRDVKGQDSVKRALEIAAAGRHNVLLIGPPGTGKSMLASRIPSILPPLTYEEAIETTKIHSAAGILPESVSLVLSRPFRAPHHTISVAALAGGGTVPVPGEITLAHNGVLFLDELPEFNRGVTEALRQPLENKEVTIARANGRITFPCSIMLVCAMNPCRCGYWGHPVHPCSCTSGSRAEYVGKISGPLLERVDMQIEVPYITYAEMSSPPQSEPSAVIRERVTNARDYAFERGGITANASLTRAQIEQYCALEPSAQFLLESAFNRMGLSPRSYDRILRVARTVADLDGSDLIKSRHLTEAIQYRALEKNYFTKQL